MSIFLNTVDSIGDDALTNSIIDRSIAEIRDNYATSIGESAFNSCSALATVDFPVATSIGYSAFYKCSKLTALILRSETMATLSNTSAFSSTPIASGTGYIYVPSALVDSYKAASNWSTYANQIRAIEDYPEICDPYSWEAVAKHIELGDYATFYKVGDCVPLDLGSEGVVNMQIAAFDADDLADGSGKAPISWISKELLATTHRMNPANSNNSEGTGTIGGWEKTEMRSYLKETVLPLIPEEVRSHIVAVKKYSRSYNTSGKGVNNVETSDDVWIPSYREICGGTSYETQGPVYDTVFNSADMLKKMIVNASSPAGWWMRSAYSAERFGCVLGHGGTSGVSASSLAGIALGFCT